MNQEIETRWDNTSPKNRLYILIDCGWRLNNHKPSRLAYMASTQSWIDLSPSVQNVLKDKNEKGLIGL